METGLEVLYEILKTGGLIWHKRRFDKAKGSRRMCEIIGTFACTNG